MSTIGSTAAIRNLRKGTASGKAAASSTGNTGAQPAAPQQALADALPLAATRGFWFSTVLFFVASSVMLTALMEWEHYRRMYAWQQLEPTLWDRIVLLWLMVFKSLMMLTPLALVATVLHGRGWNRLGRLVMFSGWSLLTFWWVADLAVQRLAGNHALDYLPYVIDALRPGDASANHTQWAGGWWGIAWMALGMLTAVIAAGLGLMLLCHRATRSMARRFSLTTQRRLLLAANLGILGLLLGVLPAQAGVSQSLVLRQLQLALPIDVTFVDPRSTGIGHLLGGPVARDGAAVRIVALLPNPAGDDYGNEAVHLHNFSDEPIDISGWHLTNTLRQRFKLDGTVQPGETRIIIPPGRKLALRNRGDRIGLYDAEDQQVDEVSYHAKEVRYATPIYFHRPQDFDNFLLKLNTSVQPIYSQYYDAIKQPKPIDEQAVFQVQGDEQPPHVLWLVCESLRHDTISPELMSRLDQWANSGLRLRQHYCGSNASHLGLFHLLYGRSPLAFDAALDRQMPPQATVSMRGSGYECTYITSGAFAHWRRMGEMVNERTFDHVVIEGGTDWRDWPVRDRAVLDHAVRLMTTSRRPQFIVCFLLTTHFPYPSPEEFQIYQPVGENVDRTNWTTVDPAILSNRYRNSALCLEHEIMRCIEQLDPQRHIVMITGDHGESLGEDGGLAHGTRASEIQLRVPLVMVGPGIPAREIDYATSHADVLPTLLSALAGQPVPVRHCYGQDLLSSPPREQLSVIPYHWTNTGQMLLIRPDQRLMLSVNTKHPAADVTGFVNSSGQLDLNSTNDLSPKAAFQWSQRLRMEFERITQ